jgi:glyoxylase-like metal-dependent hydrolase (beta-lactamase superfamily II)
MMSFDQPNSEILEVTVIGTGGGYGESVVVHLGNGKWIVIDSCIDPKSRISLPLLYLNKIGVNVPRDVVIILCTHWHDDHLQGLFQLLERMIGLNSYN